jgi:hypothetical protein
VTLLRRVWCWLFGHVSEHWRGVVGAHEFRCARCRVRWTIVVAD